MNKQIAILIAVTACSPVHDVQILYGPNEDTLTVGFRCLRDGTNELMFSRARQTGELSVVIDLYTIGGEAFPGCRGEELIALCDRVPCTRVTRFCADIEISRIDLSDPGAALASLHEQLQEVGFVTEDAPDEPTVVRAVTMARDCASIGDAAFAQEDLLGCAYSCPTLLDEVDTSIALSIDTLTDRCEAQVRACSGAF